MAKRREQSKREHDSGSAERPVSPAARRGGEISTGEVRKKHKEYLFPAVANYYREPLVLTEGKGLFVRDLHGREYLDFFGGILAISLGHAHDAVNTAVKEQIDRLSHVSTLYQTAPMVLLAEKLASLTPGRLKKCFFTVSGTEANETAAMIAQTYTGRSEVIALRHGYSGRSMLAQSLTGHGPWRALPTKVADVKHAVSPYCYRCSLKLSYPACGVACASDIEDLIKTTTKGEIAGFLAEPIQGVAGFVTPPREYFQIATEIVRKYGGVFICDEVQTGFGRTGDKWWGIEHWGVEPEIMTMAKGIANGLPLGATICAPEVADSLKALSISTFGGNPLSSAAANATITYIEENCLQENAARRGRMLQEGLKKLKRTYPRLVGEVRGMGLMQAMEFVQDETIKDRTPHPQALTDFFEETRKRGLLVGKGGLYGNVVRLAPPLTVSKAEMEEALRIIEASLSAMGAH